MDCIGKQVPVDTVVRFYVHTDISDRGFCTLSVWRQAASAMIAGHGGRDPETFVLVTIHAAAFWILCRRFNWLAGRPNRVLLQ